MLFSKENGHQKISVNHSKSNKIIWRNINIKDSNTKLKPPNFKQVGINKMQNHNIQ